MKQAIQIAIVSALLTAAALKAAPALAQPAAAETQVSVVATGDLDLSSRTGPAAAQAAAGACRRASFAAALRTPICRASWLRARCRADVLANASAQGRQIVLASRRVTRRCDGLGPLDPTAVRRSAGRIRL